MSPAKTAGRSRRVRLTLIFPPDQIQEPVVWKMSKRFEVVFNIRRARVTDKVGELVLELEGAANQIEGAMAWLRRLGIRVVPAAHDVVE